MVLVIGIGVILAILVAGGVAYAVSGQRFARNGQDWDGALSAAYAGIEEYQSRMAADPGYWRYGNAAASFSTTSASSVSTPPITNSAFGLGANGSWATVPDGGTGTSPGRFRYEVDNSDYGSTGILRLRATGKVGGSTRTLVADLKQDGFLDFLYFTDYEIRDPLVSNTSCIPAYQWAVANRPNCTEIQFASADALGGPVHSNDSLLICGATFSGHVTSANSNPPFYRVPGGCGQPNTGTTTAFSVESKSVIGMPSTNSELRKEVRSDLPSDVPRPGCLYTGPTTIEFLSNGKMTIKSPWTKLTNVVGQPATSGSVSSKCGTPGTSGLGSASGQTIDVPTNSVIYVQNIPGSTGPNYSSDSATGTGVTCKTPAGASATGNGVGYPVANEVAPSVSSASASYGCRNGDVFVKGNVAGQLTIAAENYIYVTDDLKYVNPQKDMVGLVGQNAVWIWNPVKYVYANGTNNPPTSYANVYAADDRRVDAALLSVAHSFGVQNYDRGTARGTLTVNGAIAQKFRGTVATTGGSGLSTGFYKNYLYDTRFRYTAPPKFLSPVTTTYGVTVFIETNRAFDAQGYQLKTDGTRAP